MFLDKNTLQDYIANDRLEEAAQNLWERGNAFVEQKPNDKDRLEVKKWTNVLLTNLGAWRGLTHDIHIGVRSYAEEREERARIQAAVLEQKKSFLVW